MKPIDFRELLKKYITHIVKHEGTDFLDEWNKSDSGLFSDEEWEELVLIRNEVEPEWDNILTDENGQQYVQVGGAYLAGILHGRTAGIDVIRSQIIGGCGMPLYGIHFKKDGQMYETFYDMNEPLGTFDAYLCPTQDTPERET